MAHVISVAVLLLGGPGCEESATPAVEPGQTGDRPGDKPIDRPGDTQVTPAPEGDGPASSPSCAWTVGTNGLPSAARMRIDAGSPIHSVDISPDGAWFAVATERGDVCVQSTSNVKESRLLGPGQAGAGPALAVRFTSDGSHVASAGADGRLRIWNLASGELRHDIDQKPARKRRGKVPPNHQKAALTALGATADGGLVTGGWDGRVRLWDVAAGTVQHELRSLAFAVNDIAVSPDGATIAVAASPSLDIAVFDARTGARRGMASGLVDPPRALAFTADGAQLLALDDSGKLIAFPREGKRFDEGTYVQKLSFPRAQVLSVNPATGHALVAGGMPMTPVDLASTPRKSDKIIGSAGVHKHAIAAVAARLRGGVPWIISGDVGGVAYLWEFTAGKQGNGPGDGETGGDDGKAGVIPDAYRALMADGCKLKRAGIATAIEARVLRNAPYAMAGRPFKSAELTALYSADGDWYRPGASKDIDLPRADDTCVAALKAHEKSLRKRVKLDRKVERALTGSLDVFRGLRRVSRPGLRLGHGEQRASDDQVSWIAPCNKGCKQVSIVCDIDPASGSASCEVERR